MAPQPNGRMAQTELMHRQWAKETVQATATYNYTRRYHQPLRQHQIATNPDVKTEVPPTLTPRPEQREHTFSTYHARLMEGSAGFEAVHMNGGW